MKKWMKVTLSLMLSLSMALPVLAVGDSYTFTALVNGQSSTTIALGDTVTVTLEISTTAEELSFRSFQDYVTFDRTYFQLDESSITVEDISSAQASPKTFDSGLSYDQVFVNGYGTSNVTMSDTTVVALSFDLVATQEGTTTIDHDTPQLNDAVDGSYTVSTVSATVVIGTTSATTDEEDNDSGSSSGGSSGGSSGSSSGGSSGSSSEESSEEDDIISNPFADVVADSYCYDAVLWAVENGITSGTSETTFSPNATCTRAQAVTLLWKSYGSPAVDYINPFTDVSSDAYYYEAVLWAVSEGITAGTSATTFSPNADCTRGQIVTFLYRAAGEPAVETSSTFTDVDTNSYCYDAVLWAVSEGITNGTTDTTFSPNTNCTRGQIVTFLYRNLGE